MKSVQIILEELNSLFAQNKIEEVEPFLTGELEQAYKEKEYGTCITIMNELIGFCRDISENEKALMYGEQVLTLMRQLGYEGTLPYATTMLNVANALRAAGHYKESLIFYESIFPIYEANLEPRDERIASLYNNLSLLYQEMNDFEQAVICQQKALDIISYSKDEIKIAVTHSNLAASLLQLNRTMEALSHLQIALGIYNKSEEKDFHYNAAMAAMGHCYVNLGKLQEARECYQIALQEQFKFCGKSEAYYRILDNLHMVEKKLQVPLTKEPKKTQKHINGLTLSRLFYEEVAQEKLKRNFPEQFERMAIGLVGEGSECFGFDDKYSTDHDFGPGFCIWLTHEDYLEFGQKLQTFYDELPQTFMGYTRQVVNGQNRVGVWDMDEFYRHFTGYACAGEIPKEDVLYLIPDESMATILNGAVFSDPMGMFSHRRLEFYELFTEKIWNIKLAKCLIQLAQYGQYNYGRMMKRGEYVTAQITLYKYIEGVLQLVHYVNHVFPPYYKWLKKSASGLKHLAVLADLTDALADFADGRAYWDGKDGSEDKVSGTIEIIAKLIIDECNAMGIFAGLDVNPEELFLENYGKALYLKMMEQTEEKKQKRNLAPLQDEINLQNNAKEALVDYMVSLEWQAFDEVQNQGGRADCQDNWGTFEIMRKSQYLAWPKELIICFIQDFRNANKRGWNLITEKYGRMMQTTDPKGYEGICDQLPPMSDVQKNIIEQIVKLQVSWMVEFSKEYPKMAGNSRSIHTQEDTPWNTSYETYLRGELSTYSPDTLKEYGAFVVSLAREGKNLAKIIMENTALLYGYPSLQDAEKRL